MNQRQSAQAVLFCVIAIASLMLFFALFGYAHGQQRSSDDALQFARTKMGELLFFDEDLSADGIQSCAKCHNPQKGFSDGLRVAEGINGRTGTRKTPTIYTAAYQPLAFWDGRTLGVDAQSLQPLTNPDEMGNDSVRQVARRVAPKYNALSRRLYGRAFDESVMAHAIATYEASIFTATTPAHKRLNGYKKTFATDPSAERGFQLFVSKGCMECHVPPLFTDSAFHNTGISFMTSDDDPGRIGILPQGSERNSNTVRAFKTPTLQGVESRAPYTHGGNAPSLETMVRAYNVGMRKRNNQGRMVVDRFMDPRIRPLNMNEQEIQDLVHFLSVGFVAEVRSEDPRP